LSENRVTALSTRVRRTVCAIWFPVLPYTVRKSGRVVNETQPGEAGAWPDWAVVRELVKWGGVSSLKQRLIEREAWVRSFGCAWRLRSPVREDHTEISTVDDSIAIEVSATGEAVAGGWRGDFHPRAAGGDCGASTVVCRKSQFGPAVRPKPVVNHVLLAAANDLPP
jgi:hypothetical protein